MPSYSYTGANFFIVEHVEEIRLNAISRVPDSNSEWVGISST